MKSLNVVVLMCLFALGGCAKTGLVDGIGAPCNVTGATCPFDHTCLPDDDADSSSGRCAPILDYGSCPSPTYAQKVGTVIDKAITVDEVADLAKLEGAIDISAELRFEAPGPGGLLQLGDLCALHGLQRVGGQLLISELDVATLDGLQGLGVAAGGVVVHANGSLTDLLGLQDLVVANALPGRDFGVLIANNRALDEPALQALKDAFAATSPNLKIFACGNKNSPLAVQACPDFNDLL